MKNRPHGFKVNTADDLCPICGQSTGILTSRKMKMNPENKYTSGQICTACNEQIAPNKAELETGVVMRCINCKNMALVPDDSFFHDTVHAVREKLGVPSGFLVVKTDTCPVCE